MNFIFFQKKRDVTSYKICVNWSENKFFLSVVLFNPSSPRKSEFQKDIHSK